MGDALFVPAVKADLAGQLMVRRGIGDQRIQMADPAQKASFLDMPWDDAINEFRARGIVKPNELSTLMGDYAQRADVARKLMLENIQKEVRAQLEKSLREGGTYQQFATALDEKKVSLGIADTDPHYVSMVFRTNVSSAYGAGRYKAMTDPVVMDARPYSQLRTAGDARVRDEHAAVDGVITLVGSPAFDLCSCPLGYSCRCANIPLTREEASGSQIITDVSDLPEGFKPTPGFEGPPVARLPASLPQNDNARPPQVQVPDQLQPTLPPEVSNQIAEQAQQKLTPEQTAVTQGIDDSELNYLRGGMRDLETHRSAYEGATPEEVANIAAGITPTKSGPAFEPIKIESGSSDPRYQYVLVDGRHRLQAAREAGASYILAEVDGKRLLVPIPSIKSA